MAYGDRSWAGRRASCQASTQGQGQHNNNPDKYVLIKKIQRKSCFVPKMEIFISANQKWLLSFLQTQTASFPCLDLVSCNKIAGTLNRDKYLKQLGLPVPSPATSSNRTLQQKADRRTVPKVYSPMLVPELQICISAVQHSLHLKCSRTRQFLGFPKNFSQYFSI